MCVGTLYVRMPMHDMHVLLMEARRRSGLQEWSERLLRTALSVLRLKSRSSIEAGNTLHSWASLHPLNRLVRVPMSKVFCVIVLH